MEWFWTDSSAVLSYIRNEARRFHVFVANRVQQIRVITDCLKYKEKLRERASTKEKDAMENQPALVVMDLRKSKF